MRWPPCVGEGRSQPSLPDDLAERAVVAEHSNGYGASKAALWALTNGIRVELAAQGTQVTGLVLASTDTDMMAGFEVPENRPEDVARTALDGVAAGRLEVLADADSVALKAALSRDPAETYPQAVGAA